VFPIKLRDYTLLNRSVKAKNRPISVFSLFMTNVIYDITQLNEYLIIKTAGVTRRSSCAPTGVPYVNGSYGLEGGRQHPVEIYCKALLVPTSADVCIDVPTLAGHLPTLCVKRVGVDCVHHLGSWDEKDEHEHQRWKYPSNRAGCAG